MEKFRKETLLAQKESSCEHKSDTLLACSNRKFIFLVFPDTTFTIVSFTGTLSSKIDFHIMTLLLMQQLNRIVTDDPLADDLDCTDASDPSGCTSYDAMRTRVVSNIHIGHHNSNI